jgi:hypothetical protein
MSEGTSRFRRRREVYPSFRARQPFRFWYVSFVFLTVAAVGSGCQSISDADRSAVLSKDSALPGNTTFPQSAWRFSSSRRADRSGSTRELSPPSTCSFFTRCRSTFSSSGTWAWSAIFRRTTASRPSSPPPHRLSSALSSRTFTDSSKAISTDRRCRDSATASRSAAAFAGQSPSGSLSG